ncbi:MAG: DUF115 domain-containing protein [Magnetospirillum sp.]|nr:DUF115 domain-containing protein [Magnetospirillum sp.]
MDSSTDSSAALVASTEEGRRELFEANKALFETCLPHVAKQVAAIREPQSRLVPVGEDDWDIEFSGIPLYSQGGKSFAKTQQQQWWDSPSRVRFAGPKRSAFDRNTGPAIDDLLRGFEARSIVPCQDLQTDAAFHVICMGVGLGFHLPELIARTGCHHLQIVEVNIEFVYHSWHVMDWRPVFFHDDGSSRLVRFYTYVDLDRSPLELRELLRSTNPTRVEGTVLFQHYANEQYSAVFARMLREMNLSMSGLGFLDDEIRMVRNAYLNLKRNAPLIFRKREEAARFPALIVGSGPSMDQMIEDVRRNAPYALVVACGTALPVLLRHGIRPDCFAVLENVPEIYDYVSMARDRWGLDGITLIGSITVDPRVPPMFERNVLFMRGGLASYVVFCRDEATYVPDASPTVTNTGFSIAIGLGVKEAYFFGVDLGSKVAGRHHADDSPYVADGMEFDSRFDIELRGNFGGKVMSDYTFNWSRDSFERAIVSSRGGVRVFNCSDGAFVRGTTPRLARTLNLPAGEEAKGKLLAEFWAPLSTYGDDSFADAWNVEKLVEDINDLRQTNLGILRNDQGIYKALYEFNYKLMVPPPRSSQHFIRGSLFQVMIMCIYYLNRIPEEQLDVAGDVVRQVLSDCLNKFCDHTIDFLYDLDAGKENGPWLFGTDGKLSQN